MAYTKQTWVNGSGGGTPIDATRLGVLEQGIQDAHVLSGNIVEQTYVIPATSLMTYAAGASDATKIAAINNNNTVIKAAMTANPDSVIVLDPQKAWPVQLTFDGFNDVSFTSATNVCIRGRVVLPKGTYLTQAEADAATASRVPSSPVLKIVRPFGNPIAVSTISNQQFGPDRGASFGTNPFTEIRTTFALTNGGYSAYKQGDLFQLHSNDNYAWSAAAGYPGPGYVWKASFVQVQGIGITVNAFSLTAASSAAVTASGSAAAINYTSNPNGGTNNGMESRTIKGATSNVTAYVQGDPRANASNVNRLIVSTVSGDFSAGENILDVATNQVIGTFGGMYLVMAGRLTTTYPTNPVLRKVDRTGRTEIDLSVESDSDQDLYINPWNRSLAITLTGCTDIEAKVKIKGGYQRGMTFTGCWRGKVDAWVRALPNHALETDLSQNSYGYGIGFFGTNDGIDVWVNAENVRHGISTNGVGGTYNRNARNNTVDSTGVLSTNYHGYGTTRNCRFSGRTASTFAAGIDTHEGCEQITIENFFISNAFAGGRAVSNAAGISNRGFNTVIKNGKIIDCLYGIYDNGSIPDSGDVINNTRIQNVVTDNISQFSYVQGDNASTDLTRVDIEGCSFRGDGTPTSTPWYQAGFFLQKGRFSIRNNKTENINGPHFYIKGSGGGYYEIMDHFFDFTEAIGNQSIRIEATQAGLWLINPHFRINGGGSLRPQYFIRNEAGSTPIYYRGITTSFASTFTTMPGLFQDNSGSSTPFTRILDQGETTGGSAGHNVTVAPTAAAGANASGATVTFASGSTDVSGEVIVTMSTTAGTANGPVAVITFGTAFGADVFPVVSGWQGTINRTAGVWVHSATGFSIGVANALAASTTYRFTYYVPGV